MKKLILSVLAGAALFVAPAQATVIDFIAEADGNERGVADGTTLNIGGVNVTFSATGGVAYFDDLSAGRPAGLGVCEMLDLNSQCNPSSDDNLTSGETVTLTFDNAVNLSGLEFYDSNHLNVTNSAQTLIIDGVSLTFAAAAASTFESVTSITFAHETLDYYISSITVSEVPLPAAALFMGTGLVAFARRRAKKA